MVRKSELDPPSILVCGKCSFSTNSEGIMGEHKKNCDGTGRV